jgi:tRNA G10  N-methylase Trm11
VSATLAYQIASGPRHTPSHARKYTHLIEFRGRDSFSNFRLDELEDVLSCYHAEEGGRFKYKLDIEPVIKDVDAVSKYPICGYVSFPNEDVAREVAMKCSQVRSVIEVWGDAPNLQETCRQVEDVSTKWIQEVYSGNAHSSSDSWRVIFRRFGKGGKSGLDCKGKTDLLENHFFDSLDQFPTNVDLTDSATHTMIYLENWSTYQAHLMEQKDRRLRKSQIDASFEDDVVQETSIDAAVAHAKDSMDTKYRPSRYLFGRVIATNENVGDRYDVKKRPFIGTTTMDAISSHIAANAARIRQHDVVLDPFCGTGSLLISAAALGANVVGSDIDGDSIYGLKGNNGEKRRSKNGNFVRKGGGDQSDKSIRDNFIHYSLDKNLLALIDMNAEEWAESQSALHRNTYDGSDFDRTDDRGWNDSQRKWASYAKFDAIVTDPPYGRKEKLVIAPSLTPTSDTDSPDVCNRLQPCTGGNASEGNDPDVSNVATMGCLFKIAARRLRSGGRLVFWLPTECDLTDSQLRAQLRLFEQAAGLPSLSKHRADSFGLSLDDVDHALSGRKMLEEDVNPDSGFEDYLQFERARPQRMHKDLTRWLCVYTRK